MLSYQVLDPYPLRIDGEINGFAWGLEVNNGRREIELLLCFGRAQVRKKRHVTIEKERERYIYTPSPQRSLKS